MAAVLALVLVAACQAFGTLQGRDMLPLAEQSHEHMDQALQFIRSQVSSGDLILTDKATSFQLRHYLCGQKPVNVEHSSEGFDSFTCDGLRVVSTGPNDGALTAETLLAKAQDTRRAYELSPATGIWVVQAGWASGLSGALKVRFPALSGLETRSFGRYIEIFKLPDSWG